MQIKGIEKVIALKKGIGWTHVQLDEVTKLQKSWMEQRDGYVAECRVDVYFGRLRDGRFTPVVIMNVYEQGAGTKLVVDDNCDVWENMFSTTTSEEGNDYFRYLLKHGFKVIR